MQRGQRNAAVMNAFERAHDRVLPAVAELAAGVAVGHDLLGQPRMRHDGEPEVDEVAGRVRERAELVESGGRGAANQLVHEPAPDAAAARLAADNEGAHLGDRAAQWRELRARQHVVILHGQASSSRLLAFSVGTYVVVTLFNVVIGAIALFAMLRTLRLGEILDRAKAAQSKSS